jgi:hypothetical protein
VRCRLERKVLKALRDEHLWPRTSAPTLVHRVCKQRALAAFSREHDRLVRWDALECIAQSPLPFATGFLIRVMEDRTEDSLLRGRAAESLQTRSAPRATRALMNALRDPAVEVRFWAVFALGSHPAKKAIPALEPMLGDSAVLPGWWSVGQEAEAMLDALRTPYGGSAELQAKTEAILGDPNASAEGRRWAECYDRR